MTEAEIRAKVVRTAKSYLGCKESDGSHKKIIDLYNSHKPLARSYTVKCKANGDRTNDAWCATFVSAVAIKCGYTDIMPTECSCGKMIELYKAIGRFQENDAYVPQIGDIVMYDWGDNGSGDNKGNPDHVGIVASITDGTMQIIEGNYKDAVGYRTLKVNGRYIRGYCLPDYASKATEKTNTQTTVKGADKVKIELNVLRKGDKGDQVRTLQRLLIAQTFDCGKYGADGDFGSSTLKAVKDFQIAKLLECDGIVGEKTWKALLGA